MNKYGIICLFFQNERDIKKDDFEASLSEILSDHPKRCHLRNLHYLSNKCPSEYEKEFESIREDIFSNAKVLPSWGNNIPTRWIILEKEMQRKVTEKVISYAQVIDLANISSFPNVKESFSELDSFLKYEHNIGNIIFFEDVKSYIIVDPEWLVNVFRCFVSHQYKAESMGMTEWKELQEKGKLRDKLIDKLLEKIQSRILEKPKDFVLQIMEKFDIIVQPLNFAIEQPIDNAVNENFYMPCMIKAVQFENIIEMFNVKTEDCKRTSWFCLEFSFLPPAYFNHILVSFVKKNKLMVEKNDRLSIYRNCGIFQLNEARSHILVICLSKNVIAMQVWERNCKEHLCYSEVKKDLIDLVYLMRKRYNLNITYEEKFACSDGNYCLKRERIDNYTVEKNDAYYCFEHKEMHSRTELYRSWMAVCKNIFNDNKRVVTFFRFLFFI